MAKPSFINVVNDAAIYNRSDGSEFVFFVPEKWFDNNVAQINGDVINIIGILDYTIMDKSGKFGKLKKFYWPSAFLTRPSYIEKKKDVILTKNSPKLDYRLLHYKKDAEIICCIQIPMLADNIEEIYRIFLGGSLTMTQTISYDKLQDIFMDSISFNDAAYDSTMQLLGIPISGICRNPKDKTKQFRFGDMNNMYDYLAIQVDKISKYTSPQTSITSSNWDEAVMNAILLSDKQTDSSTYSPLEKLMMEQCNIEVKP